MLTWMSTFKLPVLLECLRLRVLCRSLGLFLELRVLCRFRWFQRPCWFGANGTSDWSTIFSGIGVSSDAGGKYQVRRLDTEKLEVEGASSPLRYRLLMTEVDYHLPSRSQRFFRPLWVTFTNQLSNKLHRTNVTGATKPRQSHKASSVALLTY